MGHNVGAAADRAVKNSEKRGQTISDRSPEERLSAIRRNLEAGLFNPPIEQKFLLGQYDELVFVNQVVQDAAKSANYVADVAAQTILELKAENARLVDQNEQFRMVYEQENRSTSLLVERVLDVDSHLTVHPHEIDRLADDGGPAPEHSCGD